VNSFLCAHSRRVHHAIVIATDALMRSPRPSSRLAGPLVVEPYGFWHRPWGRVGVVAAGFALGMVVASRLLGPDAAGLDAANAALKEELATTKRALEAERLRAAELEREMRFAARDAQRLRDEAGAAREKAAKRREQRAPGPNEEGSVVASPAPAVPAPVAEAPATVPRTE
jgi:hypothetical protein